VLLLCFFFGCASRDVRCHASPFNAWNGRYWWKPEILTRHVGETEITHFSLCSKSCIAWILLLLWASTETVLNSKPRCAIRLFDPSLEAVAVSRWPSSLLLCLCYDPSSISTWQGTDRVQFPSEFRVRGK
jgi:hypothetical protein